MTTTPKDEQPWRASIWLAISLGAAVMAYRDKDQAMLCVMLFASGMWAENFGARLRKKYPVLDTKREYVLWERRDR